MMDYFVFPENIRIIAKSFAIIPIRAPFTILFRSIHHHSSYFFYRKWESAGSSLDWLIANFLDSTGKHVRFPLLVKRFPSPFLVLEIQHEYKDVPTPWFGRLQLYKKASDGKKRRRHHVIILIAWLLGLYFAAMAEGGQYNMRAYVQLWSVHTFSSVVWTMDTLPSSCISRSMMSKHDR